MKNKMPVQCWSPPRLALVEAGASGEKKVMVRQTHYNKVMVFGTFDIFHNGHKDFFRQARKYGEYLIAVVARDKNVLEAKGRLPENNEIARQQKISDSGLADIVVLGNLDNMYRVIQEYKPDVICVGYDQKYSAVELKEKLIAFGLDKTKIVRLRSFHPEIYKSSKLKK